MLATSRRGTMRGAFELHNRCHVPFPFLVLSRRTIVDLPELRKEFESKYANKLSERVKREGVANVEELKVKVLTRSAGRVSPTVNEHAPSTLARREGKALLNTRVRKDSSPVKPLADFMDLRKILSKNHTAEQVSALWTAYHASRSHGTGQGYLSATIPLSSYIKMASLAAKYASFVLPLRRPSPELDAGEPAYEFHFVQWSFHETPPHPSNTPTLLFDEPSSHAPEPAAPNPAYSTILFTPLQEYKLRKTFAQPHLVLTHYTDLATTHGVVLMRGELTPSPSSPGKYLLSSVDAQLLAMGVQRFYLATAHTSSERRVEMLRRFHEKPAEFYWEDLLAFAEPST